jgi:signal peptidase II
MQRYPLFLLIPVIFLIDRATKTIVVNNLAYLDRVPVLPSIAIVHVRNKGGAFSLLSDSPFADKIFLLLPVLIVIALLCLIFIQRPTLGKMVSLILIISGAIGNIYDRLAYGYVIDFIDIFYGRYHWPAFNVADISVTVGICLWIYIELMNSIKCRGNKGMADRAPKR